MPALRKSSDGAVGRSNSTPLRYQDTTPERDGYLANATAQFVPLPTGPAANEIAPRSRPVSMPTGLFTLDDALTSTNDDEGSGGETRTLNLAGPPEEDPEQHQLE